MQTFVKTELSLMLSSIFDDAISQCFISFNTVTTKERCRHGLTLARPAHRSEAEFLQQNNKTAQAPDELLDCYVGGPVTEGPSPASMVAEPRA